MGQIVSGYDIMPDGPDADVQKIADTIKTVLPQGVTLIAEDLKIVDFVFGMKKIQAGFVIDDSNEHAGSQLEEALKSIEGVSGVECTSTTNY